ncbi:MAG: hypothetical protein CSA84_04065 [Actinomycetales bacterium]|nr:MAG: hypothetical protein CSA84_04065 [Actinomycetales bacterium]
MSGQLSGQIVSIAELSSADRNAMFAVMDLVYAGLTRETFEEDLDAKDEVVVLRTETGDIVGFSSQKRMTAGGVEGLFSGDTVLHPAHRGSPVLWQTFARRYIFDAPVPLHWFLVSKGYRTYRILANFLKAYWPRRGIPTPEADQRVMTAYAGQLFPSDYDPHTGVLAYRTPKDRLRDTELSERELSQPEVAFFVEANPGWTVGHDLVCLAELSENNLKPGLIPLLRA